MVLKKRAETQSAVTEKQTQSHDADEAREHEQDKEEPGEELVGAEEGQNDDQEYQFIENGDVELVTAQNIAQYSFDDVLIPIFGFSVSLDASYNLYAHLQDLFKSDGIDPKDFDNAKKAFFIQGGYRMLKEKMENVEYKFLKFSQKDHDLLTPYFREEEDFNDPQGTHEALLIRFSLKKGCYATVLMRELVKSDSSIENQLIMNKMYDSSF